MKSIKTPLNKELIADHCHVCCSTGFLVLVFSALLSSRFLKGHQTLFITCEFYWLEIVFADCFLTGVVDAPYDDIQELYPIASASDCQIKCQGNPRCKYFVYRADIQHCWLKTAVGSYGWPACSVCTIGPKKCIV